MRIFYFVFVLLFSYNIQAQQSTPIDSTNRKGKIWLDGNADLDSSVDQYRAGYFFTDRLLGGTSLTIIGNDDVYVSPFVRFYLNDNSHKWRPYAETGLRLAVGRFNIENAHLALGLERTLNESTLLNLEVKFTNGPRGRNVYSATGRFNTLLGGVAWKKAAAQHFNAGSFVFSNQFFEVGLFDTDITTVDFFSMSPSVSYFLTNRLAVQGNLDFSLSDFRQITTTGERNTSTIGFDAGAGVRYYLTNKKLFNFYTEAGVNYSSRRFKQALTTSTPETLILNQFDASIGIGTSVFFNRNTSIDLGVNYRHEFMQTKDRYLDPNVRLKFWFN